MPNKQDQPMAEDASGAGSRDDRRKAILRAAVKVFAEKGYHKARISDVADEAGVAYGLVYHYFGNKDGLLATLFDTNWAFFLKAMADIAAAELSARDKLQQILDFTFQALEIAPLVVKILVLEFSRNARLGQELDNPGIVRTFELITDIFAEAKARGELQESVDPLAAAVLFLGTLESCFLALVRSEHDVAAPVLQSLTVSAMKQTFFTVLKTGAFHMKES